MVEKFKVMLDGDASIEVISSLNAQALVRKAMKQGLDVTALPN